jgi:hypothetical protein
MAESDPKLCMKYDCHSVAAACTDFKKQSRTWEAGRRFAPQESVQMNPVHILTPFLSNIHFNIILERTLRPPN